jgi:tetratricopeptide (TPR) repeat protein
MVTRALGLVARSLWKPTVMRLFRDARRCRDEGRFEDAVDLVDRGLRLDPRSAVGHLLAGSLHVVLREMGRARAAFERVLEVDPSHPRALLGLARIALEEGDRAACTAWLERALARYPDFPEAQALLGVATTADEVRALPAGRPLRIDRLAFPRAGHAVVGRADGLLLVARPWGARSQEQAARTAGLCRMATALLARAGLAPARLGVVESTAETNYLRADGLLFVSLTLGGAADTSAGLVHLEQLWTHCRADIEPVPA